MSLGNGNPKEGDKGSNFNYELKVLQGLQAIAVALENQPKYKVYTALLSQVGTSDPTATILGNTLGAIVWTRVGVGNYRGALADTFLVDKTFITTPVSGDDSSVLTGGGGVACKLYRLNDGFVSLTVGGAGDGILNYTPIEIRVYN